MGGVGLKETGLICNKCGGRLRDNVLDWDDALPEDELNRSEDFAKAAGLSLCLGTSLRIEPAASIPVLTTPEDVGG